MPFLLRIAIAVAVVIGSIATLTVVGWLVLINEVVRLDPVQPKR
jgi:hypothetical protein